MNKKFLMEAISDRYAHGECGAFALACYAKYNQIGWALVRFQTPAEDVLHFACQVRENVYFDAYGFCTLADIVSRYGEPLTTLITEWSSVQAWATATDDDIADATANLELLLQLLQAQGLVTDAAKPTPTKTSNFLLNFSRVRDEVLTLLAHHGVGPFDGGCLVCANALKAALGTGEVVVLTRATDHADHAAVRYDNLVWDLAGPLPEKMFLTRFNQTEQVNGHISCSIRPLRENDLPDAVRNNDLEDKLTEVFKRLLLIAN